MHPKPTDELSRLYTEWQALSGDEKAGILSLDWAAVAEAQRAKSALQPLIATLRSGMDSVTHETHFGALGKRLLGIEAENRRLLNERFRTADSNLVDLDRSLRNLRHIQRCYIPQPSHHWMSFS
jgi:hypothetical protein